MDWRWDQGSYQVLFLIGRANERRHGMGHDGYETIDGSMMDGYDDERWMYGWIDRTDRMDGWVICCAALGKSGSLPALSVFLLA